MSLRDASNLAEMEPHLSPHGARSVGKIGADTYSAASFGAAAAAVESAEEEAPARVVNAVHAHSEFWLPALKLCAAELGLPLATMDTRHGRTEAAIPQLRDEGARKEICCV